MNSRAEVSVQNVESHERLLEVVERAEAVVGIRLGLDSMHQGEGRPVAEALRSIGERHRERRGG